MAFKIFYNNLQGLFCFVLWRAYVYIGQKDILTTSHPFIITNVLLKMSKNWWNWSKINRHWLNVSPLEGDLNELMIHWFTEIAPKWKAIEISKLFKTVLTWWSLVYWNHKLWQFDTRSKPLFRNKLFAKVNLKCH